MDVGSITVVNTTADPTVDLHESSTQPLRFNIVRTGRAYQYRHRERQSRPAGYCGGRHHRQPDRHDAARQSACPVFFSTGSRTSGDTDPGFPDSHQCPRSGGRPTVPSGRPRRGSISTSWTAPADRRTRISRLRRSTAPKVPYSLAPTSFFTGQLVKYHANGAVLGNLLNDHYYVVISLGDGSARPAGEYRYAEHAYCCYRPTASPTDSHLLTAGPSASRSLLTAIPLSAWATPTWMSRHVGGTAPERICAPRWHLTMPSPITRSPIDAVKHDRQRRPQNCGAASPRRTRNGTTYPGGMAGHAGGILVVYGRPSVSGRAAFHVFRSAAGGNRRRRRSTRAPLPVRPRTLTAPTTCARSDSAGNLWRPWHHGRSQYHHHGWG